MTDKQTDRPYEDSVKRAAEKTKTLSEKMREAGYKKRERRSVLSYQLSKDESDEVKT